MDEKPRDDDETPDTAEPPEAEKLSEHVPDEVSGEGDTARLDRRPFRRARRDRNRQP